MRERGWALVEGERTFTPFQKSGKKAFYGDADADAVRLLLVGCAESASSRAGVDGDGGTREDADRKETVLGTATIRRSCEATTHPGKKNVTLNQLVVREDVRMKGVGKTLLNCACAYALSTDGEFGAELVTVWCEAALLPFYESAGFVYEAPFKPGYDDETGDVCCRLG